jgi:hypothetical protein
MEWMEGVQLPEEARDFPLSTALRPALPGGQPSLPSDEYQGAPFPMVKWPGREAGPSPHLVPRIRMVERHLHSSIRLHGVMLN